MATLTLTESMALALLLTPSVQKSSCQSLRSVIVCKVGEKVAKMVADQDRKSQRFFALSRLPRLTMLWILWTHSVRKWSHTEQGLDEGVKNGAQPS